MPSPESAPAERLAGILFGLTQLAVARSLIGKLSPLLLMVITDRLRAIKHIFYRLAARVAAGTYTPRRATKREPRPGQEPPTEKKPRTKNPLPQAVIYVLDPALGMG